MESKFDHSHDDQPMQRHLIAAGLAVLFAGAAAALAVLSSRGVVSLPRTTVGLGLAFLAAVLTFVVIRTARRRRSGRHVAAEAIERNPDLDYQRRAPDGFHRSLHLASLPRRGDSHHLITGTHDGAPITAFQHSYVINTGQAVLPVYSTILCTPIPATWPRVVIRPRSLWHWALDKLGLRRGMELEDEVFQRRFRIITDAREFAELVLTPEIQAHVATKPNTTWDLSGGRLALIYRGRMRFDRLDQSFERLLTLRRMIPEEMDAWGGGE